MIMNRKLLLCIVSGALLVAATAWADPKEDVIAAFFNVDQALANGDLNAVKTAASDLAQKAQSADSQAILKDADDLAKADSIDQARQLHKALGEDILGLVKTREGSQNTVSGACPMMNSRNTASDGCPMMGSQNTASATCSAMMGMMRRCSSM